MGKRISLVIGICLIVATPIRAGADDQEKAKRHPQTKSNGRTRTPAHQSVLGYFKELAEAHPENEFHFVNYSTLIRRTIGTPDITFVRDEMDSPAILPREPMQKINDERGVQRQPGESEGLKVYGSLFASKAVVGGHVIRKISMDPSHRYKLAAAVVLPNGNGYATMIPGSGKIDYSVELPKVPEGATVVVYALQMDPSKLGDAIKPDPSWFQVTYADATPAKAR